MKIVNTFTMLSIVALATLANAPLVLADELVQMIQKDLVTLGYDPGSIDGELTTKTQIAISKFQTDNDIPATGEASPQLAGVTASKVDQMRNGGQQKQVQASAEEAAAADVNCQQKKAEESAEKRQKATGFRRLAGAGTRLLGRFGKNEAASAASDVYVAGSAAGDAAVAADELGITDEDC